MHQPNSSPLLSLKEKYDSLRNTQVCLQATYSTTLSIQCRYMYILEIDKGMPFFAWRHAWWPTAHTLWHPPKWQESPACGKHNSSGKGVVLIEGLLTPRSDLRENNPRRAKLKSCSCFITQEQVTWKAINYQPRARRQSPFPPTAPTTHWHGSSHICQPRAGSYTDVIYISI